MNSECERKGQREAIGSDDCLRGCVPIFPGGFQCKTVTESFFYIKFFAFIPLNIPTATGPGGFSRVRLASALISGAVEGGR